MYAIFSVRMQQYRSLDRVTIERIALAQILQIFTIHGCYDNEHAH
jgi:hypothetical protein